MVWMGTHRGEERGKRKGHGGGGGTGSTDGSGHRGVKHRTEDNNQLHKLKVCHLLHPLYRVQ